MFAQAAVALLSRLVGGKESDPHLLALQHLGNMGGNTHMAGVKGEVNGLLARCR